MLYVNNQGKVFFSLLLVISVFITEERGFIWVGLVLSFVLIFLSDTTWDAEHRKRSWCLFMEANNKTSVIAVKFKEKNVIEKI